MKVDFVVASKIANFKVITTNLNVKVVFLRLVDIFKNFLDFEVNRANKNVKKVKDIGFSQAFDPNLKV